MGIEEQWHSRTVEKLKVEDFEWKAVKALVKELKRFDQWSVLGYGIKAPPCKLSRKEIKDLLKAYNIPFDNKNKFEHSFIITDDPNNPGEFKIGALSRAKRENEGIEGHGGFGVARIRQFEDLTCDIVKITTGAIASIEQETKMLKMVHNKEYVGFFSRDKDDSEVNGAWEWIGGTVVDNNIKHTINREITTKHYIIQPFIPGEELFDKLNSDRMLALNPHHSIDIAIAIAKAVASESLHGGNIVHADLKTENIKIIEDEANQLWTAVPVDYGMALKLKKSDEIVNGPRHGTLFYMAPEIKYPEVKGESKFSKSSDIYALGVMLREDLSLRSPFINKMLSYDPSERPDISAVIINLLNLKQELSVDNYLDQYQDKAKKKQPSLFKKYRIKTPEQLAMLEQLKQVIAPKNPPKDFASQADEILAILGANQLRHDKTLFATASSFNFKVLQALPVQIHNICLVKLGIEKNQSFFLLKPTKENRQKLAGYLREYNKTNSLASQQQQLVVSRGPGV